MSNEYNFDVGDLLEVTFLGRAPKIGIIAKKYFSPSSPRTIYRFITSQGEGYNIFKTKLGNSVFVKVLAKVNEK